MSTILSNGLVDFDKSATSEKMRNGDCSSHMSRGCPSSALRSCGIVATMTARVSGAGCSGMLRGSRCRAGSSPPKQDDRAAIPTLARTFLAIPASCRSVCVRCGDIHEEHKGVRRIETAAGACGPRVSVPVAGPGQRRVVSGLG